MAGTFYARYEKALRVSAGPAVDGGRLQGATAVQVVNLVNSADTLPASAPYELFGPGDVQRLAGGAITRRHPAAGAGDAEETKLALVEFAAPDLPWRYTPAKAAGVVLRPWLVLVVGRRSAAEITLRPDGRVTLGPVTQAAHPLGSSGLWAHVHDVDGRQIARIVSPLNLASEQDYVACVVPAFRPDGTDAWSGAPVTVDCYDRWAFRTGPQGDFPELAAKLHKADVAALEKPFGRAEVTYRPRAGGDPIVLPTAGALRLPPDGAPDAADAPPPPAVVAEVTALSQRIVTPDGRGVVTAPRYEAPFTDPARADLPPDPGGWVEGLRSDPRSRGAAALGVWTVIEWQDRISDAAAAKAGDLAIAHDRIRHVALGVEASRSLWRRRVPPASAPADRLAVLAPVLGRLPAAPSGTVLDQITGHTPAFTRTLLSSAARRALRPGPARAGLARPGAGRFGAVLDAANGCPRGDDDPADIRGGMGDPESATRDAVLAATGGDEELAGRILERLGGQPSPGLLVAAFTALAPGEDGRPDRDVVARFLDGGEFPEPDVPLTDWPSWMGEMDPPEPCRPIDLGGVSRAVAGAVDPTVERPPAIRRVLATLPGFTHIGPVEIEPELDLPLWSFLSDRSPDWMLPGAGDLKEHDVVGLSTNPAFVQALLAGANQQATGELRWRNIPMVTRWSPLRKFWQRTGGAVDIVPVKGWPVAEPLGSTVLADGGRGAEAVVAFRTPLFRRYPTTVVYLYPAASGFAPPGPGELVAGRKDPTFTGRIGADITFFGFDVALADLKTHWVVLEEPPAGYRFYHGDQIPPPLNEVPAPPPAVPDDTSAAFAYNRFATPVRVLIGPLL